MRVTFLILPQYDAKLYLYRLQACAMNQQRVPFILPSGCCLNSQLANKQVMEVLPLRSMKLELSCVKTIKGKSADFI